MTQTQKNARVVLDTILEAMTDAEPSAVLVLRALLNGEHIEHLGCRYELGDGLTDNMSIAKLVQLADVLDPVELERLRR